MTYLAYTGIGSRETPTYYLNIMHHIAGHLYANGWTLRSGHANGADMAFENGADNAALTMKGEPRKEIYLPWRGFNGSNSELHPQKIPFSDQELTLSAQMHPAWHKCSPSAQKLHARNLRQIVGSEYVNGDTVVPVKFVICWTRGGQLIGGTAQAIRIAMACNIPVYNFGLAKSEDDVQRILETIEEARKACT